MTSLRLAPPNAQTAALLGVSETAVVRYRHGTRLPKMATRKKIAEILGWPVSAQADADSEGLWAEEFNWWLEQPREADASAAS